MSYISSLCYFLPVELSSDAATQNSARDIEAELREMRLSLLTEIEKRKLIEESLNNMSSQWESIRQGLSEAGIVLPADLTAVAEGEQLNSDPVEDLCQQLHVARFISNAIGRGTVRAEVEMEMEAQLEAKNFEIARLLERLHFYETTSREMSQRNQEAVGETCILSPVFNRFDKVNTLIIFLLLIQFIIYLTSGNLVYHFPLINITQLSCCAFRLTRVFSILDGHKCMC